MKKKTRGEVLQKRRMKAAALFRQRTPQAIIARKLRVTEATVSRWHAAWAKKGVRGLRSKGSPGFPSTFTKKKRRAFERAIRKGPLHFGFTTNVWTLERFQIVLRKVTRLHVGTTWMWHIVHSMGYTPQRPQVRVVRRNEAAIEAWKKRRLPGLKKMGGRAWIFAWI
jgi:transposase